MNKGFTMVELVSVIVILALIMIIAMPAYNTVATEIKQNALSNKESTIIASMDKFANEHLLDEIKPINVSCSGNNCCMRYDLYNYILKNDIYSIETYKNDEPYIENPYLGGKLEGYVEIKYNTSKYTIESTFKEGSLGKDVATSECN